MTEDELDELNRRTRAARHIDPNFWTRAMMPYAFQELSHFSGKMFFEMSAEEARQALRMIRPEGAEGRTDGHTTTT